MIYRPFEDPDDDDDPDATPPKDDHVKNAVVIAVLSAFAGGLISWGIDELRTVFGSKPKCPKCEKSKDDKET